MGNIAKNHGSDLVLFKVESHPIYSSRKFEHLGGHAAWKPLDPRNPVPGFNNLAYLLHFYSDLVLFNMPFQNGGYLFWLNLQFHCAYLHYLSWREDRMFFSQ